MKSIWLALSVIAVANALGLLAFFGWLSATDRLDRARFEQVRAIFVPTAAQVKAEEQKKAAQAEAESRAAASRFDSVCFHALRRRSRSVSTALRRVVASSNSRRAPCRRASTPESCSAAWCALPTSRSEAPACRRTVRMFTVAAPPGPSLTAR